MTAKPPPREIEAPCGCATIGPGCPHCGRNETEDHTRRCHTAAIGKDRS